jgi:hypothetical protein
MTAAEYYGLGPEPDYSAMDDLAAELRRAFASCLATGEMVEFRTPDDDYRTDCRWRHQDGTVCHHKIARR